MSGRSPAPGWWQGFYAGEPLIKAEIEIDAPHLTVSDDVGAGAELIIDRQTNSVSDGLVAVLGPKQLGLPGDVFAQLGVPAGEGPAADHCRREHREQIHAGNLSDRARFCHTNPKR